MIERSSLSADGGITIHIAAERPEDVPEENWLPFERGDYGIDIIMCLYAPDLEAPSSRRPGTRSADKQR